MRFTLTKKQILTEANANFDNGVKGVRFTAQLSAMKSAALAAGIKVIDSGNFALVCEMPDAQFKKMFGISVVKEKGFGGRVIPANKNLAIHADYVEVAPPIEYF